MFGPYLWNLVFFILVVTVVAHPVQLKQQEPANDFKADEVLLGKCGKCTLLV